MFDKMTLKLITTCPCEHKMQLMNSIGDWFFTQFLPIDATFCVKMVEIIFFVLRGFFTDPNARGQLYRAYNINDKNNLFERAIPNPRFKHHLFTASITRRQRKKLKSSILAYSNLRVVHTIKLQMPH